MSSNCLPQVRELIKQSGKRVSEDVINQIHKHMQSLLELGMTREEFAGEVKELIGEEMQRRARAVKTSKLMALSKYNAVTESAVRNKALGISAYEHLRAVIEGGSLKAGDGLNLSAEGREKTLMARFLTMFNQLDQIRDEINSGILDKDIVQEKAALQGEGKAGETKSSAAKRAAEIFHSIQRVMFDMKKASNPLMRFNDRYYFEATHSAERLKAVSKSEWIDFILETHGEKSFPEMDTLETQNALSNIYDAITTGTYGTGSGGGNILFSMSKGRVLIPNDWKSFYDYHQKFGEGTISEVMYSSMRKASREISLLQKFGPEYRKFFEEAYRRAEAVADPKDRLELQKNKKYLSQSFETAIGDVDRPATGMRAKLVQGAMMWENMALNGFAVISSMPDFALTLGLIQDVTGRTQFEIAKDFVSNALASARNPTEARAIAQRLGLFAEANVSAMMRELGSELPASGFGGKTGKTLRSMSELYGKVTLMGRYLEANRSAIGVTLSNYLAEIVSTTHANLHPKVKQGLLRYGIGEAEWSTFKFATEKVDFLGREVTLLNTESVMNMPDAVIENYMRKQGTLTKEATKSILDKGRLDLATKIGSLINEHADLGTSTSTTRTKTFLYRGLSINDGWGQVLRLIAQFKSAGFVTSDVVRRRYHSGQTPKGKWAAAAQTGVQLMLLAGIAQYASDAARGKTPEDPRNPGFILKMLARSSIGGPYMDALLGELNRNGVDGKMLSTARSLAGPVPSKIAEAIAIVAQAGQTAYKNNVEGENASYPSKRAFDLAASQIPGQNLFWTTGVLNYYFLNEVRESLDHGYTAALKRETNKKPGLLDEKQDYFMLDPTE